MVEYWKVEDPVFSGIDFQRKRLIRKERMTCIRNETIVVYQFPNLPIYKVLENKQNVPSTLDGERVRVRGVDLIH